MSDTTEHYGGLSIGSVITDSFGVKWVVYAFEDGEPIIIGRIGRHNGTGFPPGGADFHAGPSSYPAQLVRELLGISRKGRPE